MNIKRLISFLLVLVMMTGSLNVLAADSPPDVIITDVRLSNPYYKVGDVVSIIIDVKNIGGASMPLGYVAISRDTMKGIEMLTETSKWTRPNISPGETLTAALVDFRITDENVSFTAVCNSGGNAKDYEPNTSNNTTKVSFTPIKAKCDLVITDIKVSNTNFAEGDVATFNIEYENAGTEAIPYSSIEIEMLIGGKTYKVNEVAEVLPHEKRVVKSEGIYVEGEEIKVTAYINSDDKVDEDNLDNNSYTKTISALATRENDYTWQPAKIHGGGAVQNLFVNPNVKDELYLLADMDGPFKYDQHTRYNTPLLSNLPRKYSNMQFSLGLTAASDNPDIMYYLGGEEADTKEGIYRETPIARTFDGGKTWAYLDKPFIVCNLQNRTNGVVAFDPNNSNILYVCSYKGGLWKTENALANSLIWENVTLPGFEFTKEKSYITTNIIFDDTVVKDGRTQNFYVSVNGLGVFKTTDTGNSFTLLEGGPKKDIYNLWLDAKKRPIAFSADGVFRYEDDSWVDISPKKAGKYYGAVDYNDANKMVAIADSNIVYVTVDGGVSWKDALKNSTLTNKIPWHPDKFYTMSPYCVRFDPFRPNRVIYGAWFGAYETMDITAENVVWNDITYGEEELCSRSLVALPEGSDAWLIYGVNDVNCIKIDSPFETPTVHINYPNMQETVGIDFCEKQPNFIARVGALARGSGAGNVGYSTDGGNTWHEVNDYPKKADGVTRAAHGKIAVAADFNDNGIPTMLTITTKSTVNADGNTITAEGKLYRSIDLGDTWTEVKGLPNNMVDRWIDTNQPLASDRVNKDIFYAFDGVTGNFLISKDNGASFSVQSNICPAEINTVNVVPVFGKEGHVYVSLRYGGLWYSTDYGANFKKIDAVEISNLFDVGAIAPCSGNPTMYVYGTINGTNGVFRSVDLGKSWVKISDDSQHTLWQDIGVLKADRRNFGMVHIGMHGLALVVGYPANEDLMPPNVGIYNDIDGKTVNTSTLTLKGGATEKSTIYMTFNDESYTLDVDSDNRYSKELNLKTGENKVSVYAVDDAGNKSNVASVIFTYSPEYVGLSMARLYDTSKTEEFDITGQLETDPKKAAVTINGEEVYVDRTTGVFKKSVLLAEGYNSFEIKAVTKAGKAETVSYVVNRDLIPPTISFENLASVTDDALLVLKAKLSEPGTVRAGNNTYTANTEEETYLEIPFALKEGDNTLDFELIDLCGNVSNTSVNIKLDSVEGANGLGSDEVIAYVGTPVIDGVIDDIWKLTKPVSKVVDGAAMGYARYGLMTDNKNLYFAIEVHDPKVCMPDGVIASTHLEDTVEIYFDPEMDRNKKYTMGDQQIRLGINNIPFSCTKSIKLESIATKTTVTDFGYVLEAAIPWEVINVNYAEGTKFGFDVGINDCNANGTRDGAYIWNGTGTNYATTENFGTAYILKKQ